MVFCNKLIYTIVQKYEVCTVFLNNTCMQWRCIKLIKSDTKDSSNVTEYLYFKWMLLFV